MQSFKTLFILVIKKVQRMTKVFIDGSAGTTGLRIYDRIADRPDVEFIRLSEENRKEISERAKALNEADIAFLCLPDAAAIEAVNLLTNDSTVIIDTSTAHRTSPDFVYGFPEITGREKIASAKRISSPGCHASGFIALVYPLVKAGAIKKDARLTCFSLTGYSGGGKKMIAEYEAPDRPKLLDAPRQYGISQQHKHLKEMTYICGLDNTPVFCPIVADFYSGMEVSVALTADMTSFSTDRIKDIYKKFYKSGQLIYFKEDADESGFLSAAALSGRDDMEISLSGNEERMILTARFDNLGKGASGSAIQNMNIVMGLDETTGLITEV